ncbi:hypothetical protein [Streptomyces sp. NPDC059786]|uniref:hypothetical protein n=1 Tax=Streptomyces sp. NPDC059786 TaxID=3346946 RepID=UPI003669786D
MTGKVLGRVGIERLPQRESHQAHPHRDRPGRARRACGVVEFGYAPTGLALLLGAALVATLDHRVQLLAAGALGLTTAVLLAVTGRPRAVPPAGPDAPGETAPPDAATPPPYQRE